MPSPGPPPPFILPITEVSIPVPSMRAEELADCPSDVSGIVPSSWPCMLFYCKMVEAMTPAQIQRMAQRLLDAQRRIEVTMLSE